MTVAASVLVYAAVLTGLIWWFNRHARNAERPPTCYHHRPRNYGLQAEYDCPNCKFLDTCRLTDENERRP